MQARGMTVAAERNAARRVMVALLLVAVLAGIGTTFPRDVDAAEAGRVLLSQWAHLAHAVLGVAVLIDAAVLATRALRPPASRGWCYRCWAWCRSWSPWPPASRTCRCGNPAERS